MDRVYGPFYSAELCRHALALHALSVRDAKMLEAVLDEHADDIEWPSHNEYDEIKYKLSEWKIVLVVRKSRFKSLVPRGKRFRDLHLLDYLA